MAAASVEKTEQAAAADHSQHVTSSLPIKTIDHYVYEELSFDDACSKYPHFRHAAHCIIYSFDDRTLWIKAKKYANVMMQMRFDGALGFAGGYVDAVDDTIVTGLNRELVEEFNFDLSVHKITQSNHIVSHVCIEKRLVNHLYGLEVTVSQYSEIERRVLSAHEWGLETLGILQVPLYTMNDGIRGLPLFLTGRFIGNSKQQLLTAIERRGIIPIDELQRSINQSNAILTAS